MEAQHRTNALRIDGFFNQKLVHPKVFWVRLGRPIWPGIGIYETLIFYAAESFLERLVT